MNKVFLFFIFVVLSACQNQQNAPALPVKNIVETSIAEVKTTLDAFGKAYGDNDNEAFQAFLHKDIIVYGTDPSEAWPYDVFKNHIPETTKQNLPKLTLKNLNSIHISNDGSTACIIREVEWKPIFENSLRQTIMMEKIDGSWKVKMISLAHLLPNKGAEEK